MCGLIQLLISFFRFEHINSLFECNFCRCSPIQYPFNALYLNCYAILWSNIFEKSSLTFIKLHFEMALLRFNASNYNYNLFQTFQLSLKYDVYSLNCLVSLQYSTYVCVVPSNLHAVYDITEMINPIYKNQNRFNWHRWCVLSGIWLIFGLINGAPKLLSLWI